MAYGLVVVGYTVSLQLSENLKNEKNYVKKIAKGCFKTLAALSVYSVRLELKKLDFIKLAQSLRCIQTEYWYNLLLNGKKVQRLLHQYYHRAQEYYESFISHDSHYQIACLRQNSHYLKTTNCRKWI